MRKLQPSSRSLHLPTTGGRVPSLATAHLATPDNIGERRAAQSILVACRGGTQLVLDDVRQTGRRVGRERHERRLRSDHPRQRLKRGRSERANAQREVTDDREPCVRLAHRAFGLEGVVVDAGRCVVTRTAAGSVTPWRRATVQSGRRATPAASPGACRASHAGVTGATGAEVATPRRLASRRNDLQRLADHVADEPGSAGAVGSAGRASVEGGPTGDDLTATNV